MAVARIDTFAVANPAFCSLILHAFVSAYCQTYAEGMPIAFILLPLSIVMTPNIAQTLDRTNRATGLLPWVAHNQELMIAFSEKIKDSAEFSKAALLFGIRYEILRVEDTGLVLDSAKGLKSKARPPVSTELGKMLQLAQRLGHWVAEVGTPSTVFVALGAQ